MARDIISRGHPKSYYRRQKFIARRVGARVRRDRQTKRRCVRPARDVGTTRGNVRDIRS